MQRKALLALVCALALTCVASMAWGKATPEEIARLGADLTPLGAVKAGNEDGTIPAWEGGIATPPEGYQPGMHHPDPYADGVGRPRGRCEPFHVFLLPVSSRAARRGRFP